MVKFTYALAFFFMFTCSAGPTENLLAKKISPCGVQGLYQLMKDTDELFRSQGISYWLEFGSLLGAIRHKGFIPWDFDLDISIMLSDAKKLEKLKPYFTKLGYCFRKYKKGIYKVSLKGIGTMDIFLMEETNDGLVVFAKKYLWRNGKRGDKPLHYTHEERFPLKEYRFGPLTLSGAPHPEPYLDAYYGPEWRDIAIYKCDDPKGRYSCEKVFLTDKLRRPALPKKRLKNRVCKLLRKLRST